MGAPWSFHKPIVNALSTFKNIIKRTFSSFPEFPIRRFNENSVILSLALSARVFFPDIWLSPLERVLFNCAFRFPNLRLFGNKQKRWNVRVRNTDNLENPKNARWTMITNHLAFSSNSVNNWNTRNHGSGNIGSLKSGVFLMISNQRISDHNKFQEVSPPYKFPINLPILIIQKQSDAFPTKRVLLMRQFLGSSIR